MLFLAAVLMPLFAFAQEVQSECYGPKDSDRTLIYLHGMGPPAPDALELENRKVLAEIAERLKIRIALPRATTLCLGRSELLCWDRYYKSASEVEAAIMPIEQSAKICFRPGQSYGILGFSSGGHLTNKVTGYCKGRHFDFVVSVGAATNSMLPRMADLSKCGKLTLLFGKQDKSHGELAGFVAGLKKRQGAVVVHEHEGGHVLDRETTARVLDALFEERDAAALTVTAREVESAGKKINGSQCLE